MGLSNKRRVFVEEYLKCWNATEAAKQAGYSPRTAYSQGPRLLEYVEVKAAIEKRISELTMQADEVLILLAEQARASVTEVIQPLGKTFIIPIDEALEHGRLIKRIKHGAHGIEIELYNSQRALEMIGKHLGLFSEKMDVSLRDKEITIRVVYGDDDKAEGDDGSPEEATSETG